VGFGAGWDIAPFWSTASAEKQDGAIPVAILHRAVGLRRCVAKPSMLLVSLGRCRVFAAPFGPVLRIEPVAFCFAKLTTISANEDDREYMMLMDTVK
jgi:hypothetical protein